MVGEPSNRDYIKVIASDITTIYGLGNAVTVIDKLTQLPSLSALPTRVK